MGKPVNTSDRLLAEIKERSGQEVNACIQCGKCTAGCPMVEAMDLLPRQVMLLLQMGNEKEVAVSRTPWVCASCFTCGARCPRDLDLSSIMEAVRLKVLRPRDAKVLSPGDLSVEMLKELPQQALVSGFRKFSR